MSTEGDIFVERLDSMQPRKLWMSSQGQGHKIILHSAPGNGSWRNALLSWRNALLPCFPALIRGSSWGVLTPSFLGGLEAPFRTHLDFHPLNRTENQSPLCPILHLRKSLLCDFITLPHFLLVLCPLSCEQVQGRSCLNHVYSSDAQRIVDVQ